MSPDNSEVEVKAIRMTGKGLSSVGTRTFAPDKLRKARRRLRWTQAHLARLADVGWVTISRLENGVQVPYPNTVKALAEALRIPVSDLYDNEVAQ